MHHIPLLFLCLIATQEPVRAVLPQDPIQCGTAGCTLSNAYAAWSSDRTECRAAEVTYPRTEQELVAAVARAARLGLKAKAASGFIHSIPRTMCPGRSGGVVISTRDYAAVEVDAAEMTATAESGAGLRAVLDKADEAGLSLVAASYWEGVSVGGMIGSGAHGSSWWGRGGSVHDHVVGLSLVVPASASEGYAKVVWLDDSPSSQHLFDAAKLSLGLLGVISKVKFSLEKGFKRSITYNFTDEAGIEETIAEHGKRNEFGDITWYPSKHMAVYRYDNRVPLTTPGHGSFDFIGFQSNPILISQTIRNSEKALEKTRNSKGKCPLAATTIFAKKLVANGLKNNALTFTGYPVIGHQSRMQTSGSCLYSHRLDAACAWDPRFNGLSFFETTAVFPLAGFTSFLRDVMELRRVRPLAFCGADMYNGFLIRFVAASRAYLGQEEDSVVVDFNYYRASEGLTPRLDQDVWEEVEQMAFFKHKARPHWGKNRDVAFLGVADKFPRFGRFLEAKRELDPLGLFSNEWSDKLGFGGNISSSASSRLSDGCALEGQCVCSEDRHCSPHNDYFCKQGLVYKEARVCRHVRSF